jgi:hypothetical protein
MPTPRWFAFEVLDAGAGKNESSKGSHGMQGGRRTQQKDWALACALAIGSWRKSSTRSQDCTAISTKVSDSCLTTTMQAALGDGGSCGIVRLGEMATGPYTAVLVQVLQRCLTKCVTVTPATRKSAVDYHTEVLVSLV